MLFSLALLLFAPQTARQLTAQTLQKEMEKLHRQRGVNFVYDASLNVSRPYKGQPLDGLSLEKALANLFHDSDIDYLAQGRYVLLKRRNEEKTTGSENPLRPKGNDRRHTVSGYVGGENGERLLHATVYDLDSRQGTLSNSHGFYSITLDEGVCHLRFSYVGYADTVIVVDLHRNLHKDVALTMAGSIDEVIVEGDLNAPLLTTQTGKRSLQQNDINTEYALLSSPDIVKTLQRLSGVHEGIELASGLYVHGGNNDENLYLLDGTPLYQVNHTLGLFSSFNTDIVKNVDFYKSGFPARYGGRLSSVVDVRTSDGDMNHTHGSYRIGLLDGAFHLEGPIKWKGERSRIKAGEVRGVDFGTSYNIGLRRSWLDLLSRPAFAIARRFGDPDEQFSMCYDFHDLNAKVTHVFSSRSRMHLSLYSGRDKFTTDDEYTWQPDNGFGDKDVTKNRFNWGNFNAALNWNYQLSPRLFANFTAVYTHNRAKYSTKENDRSWNDRGEITSVFRNEHGYRSTIYDAGYRSEFDYRPSPHHHIRFGHDYTMHLFRPQTHSELVYYGDETLGDTAATSGTNRHLAHEMSLYAEDEMALNSRWSVNIGANLNLFDIQRKTFVSADPRMALKWQVSPVFSAKASYTLMSQFVHKISNAFLELPTDYWVPTTKNLRPMRSRQLAVGLYWKPLRRWLLSAEGYLKDTDHLLQYSNWNGIEPPATKWDQDVMDGKGRFYGMELDAEYKTRHVQLTGAYTLSWSKRKYDDFYSDWYYDKFDNRHKVNLMARINFSEKTDFYAAWTWHTGNRMTFPTQYVRLPDLAEGEDHRADSYGYDSHYGISSTQFIYEKPNNVTLPAYHRLDLGFNFRHTTKAGHERIWNFSVYNAYCHLNSMWIDVDYTGNGKFRVKNKGFIPIIPSLSYTIKF